MISKMFRLRTLTEYSDDSLLDELRRVASELGETRLTHDRFNELSRVHSSTLGKRFGSWQNALDLAGIDERIAPRKRNLTRDQVLAEIQKYTNEFPGMSPTAKKIRERLNVGHKKMLKFGKWSELLGEVGIKPVPLGRRYSEEECYENILALWTYYGRQPHYAELKRPPSTVGAKPYISRWGGWRKALSAFVQYVNQPSDDAMNTAGEKFVAEKPILDSCPPQQGMKVRSLSLKLRYKVIVRDKFRCQICGRSPANENGVILHVDHIKPWSKGGENTEDNLRALCRDCNLGKGADIEPPR